MEICIVYGAIIAGVVSVAKRWRFIARNPKIVAAMLSAAAAAVPVLHPGAPWPDIGALLQCFAVQFAGAVATHETGIKWIQHRLSTELRR